METRVRGQEVIREPGTMQNQNMNRTSLEPGVTGQAGWWLGQEEELPGAGNCFQLKPSEEVTVLPLHLILTIKQEVDSPLLPEGLQPSPHLTDRVRPVQEFWSPEL